MAKRVKKSDLSERLRADIVAGFYRPGEWLRLVDLEERYNVGRFEVRQALAHLLSGHLVSHIPNRGYKVAETNHKQRLELTATRLLLEVPAAKLVIERADKSDVDHIEAAAREFDDAYKSSPYLEVQRLNHAFHRAFYSCCANATLTTLIHELRERDLPGEWSQWSGNQWTDPNKIRVSSLDHLEMVAALKDRDPSRMAIVVEKHLTRWQEGEVD